MEYLNFDDLEIETFSTTEGGAYDGVYGQSILPDTANCSSAAQCNQTSACQTNTCNGGNTCQPTCSPTYYNCPTSWSATCPGTSTMHSETCYNSWCGSTDTTCP